MIFISVRESLFYGIMQAGKKLRIVYIGEVVERSVRKCFDRLHLLTCIWSDQELIESWFVIQQLNLLMFSWSIISVVSLALHLLDFSCAECSLCERIFISIDSIWGNVVWITWFIVQSVNNYYYYYHHFYHYYYYFYHHEFRGSHFRSTCIENQPDRREWWTVTKK